MWIHRLGGFGKYWGVLDWISRNLAPWWTASFVCKPSHKKTPPRAWGRLGAGIASRRPAGNTPTGVGKTIPHPSPPSIRRKHPHGRGEDHATEMLTELILETPPRAWGRRATGKSDAGPSGNTPTGVGKTTLRSLLQRLSRKHPHGRGEDGSPSLAITLRIETPPRAWGRLLRLYSTDAQAGNTPTGVGKTHSNGVLALPRRKHPHGRGEDLS